MGWSHTADEPRRGETLVDIFKSGIPERRRRETFRTCGALIPSYLHVILTFRLYEALLTCNAYSEEI